MVISEAMAAGLPVIAFDTGGLRERVRTGEDSLLIPKGDIKAFAEALDALCNNIERLEKMSRMARKHAEMEFDRSIMSQKYLEIYNS
jgi:glycosyltransferase involved in cell wall biosynthesis